MFTLSEVIPVPSSGLLPESEANKLALVFVSPAEVHMREVRPFSTANWRG